MRAKCRGDTFSRFFVFCHHSLQQVFFWLECSRCGNTEPRWNRNRSGEGCREKKLIPRDQTRSRGGSKKNAKKKIPWRLKRLPAHLYLCILHWTIFYRFLVRTEQLSTLSFSLSLFGCSLTTVKFRKYAPPNISPRELVPGLKLPLNTK